MNLRQDMVQYGCGHSPAPGWRNFDASPTLRFERVPIIGLMWTKNAVRFPPNVEYGDIVKGLPVSSGTCSRVYCSHVLEHLSLDDLRRALRNTHLILKPGGVFRLVLPDLEYLIRRYLADASPDAALKMMRESGLGLESRPRGLFATAKVFFGNSRHLWMWDYRALSIELENAGFISIRRAEIGDSEDPAFSAAEDASRWLHCLGIECRKV